MIRMGMNIQGKCFLCADEDETANHLFMTCIFSRKLLSTVIQWCKVHIPVQNAMGWWLQWRCKSATRKKIIGMIIAACFYFVWFVRNRSRVEYVVMSGYVVLSQIKWAVLTRIDSIQIRKKYRKKLNWKDDIKR